MYYNIYDILYIIIIYYTLFYKRNIIYYLYNYLKFNCITSRSFYINSNTPTSYGLTDLFPVFYYYKQCCSNTCLLT